MNRDESTGISRRYFTAAGAMAVLAGVVVTLTDCSSSSPTTPSSPPPGTGGGNDVNGVISANHGHVATITRAQLTAGGNLNLDIQGTASHTHTVSITQAEMASIAAGQRVSKTSTNNSGHMHDVTFN